MVRRVGAAAALGGLLLAAAACGATAKAHVPATAAGTASASAPSAAPSTTVWLCRPGQNPDPCAGDLADTAVPASGARTVQHAAADTTSAFDCFYVYPTVSTEAGDNADLQVQPVETDAAIAQAAQFSQVCRVWAPMYRQRTASSLEKGLGADPQADTVAYDSLLAAWQDYLAHDNDGRRVIFLGHSQGSALLIRLLAAQVDGNPSLRARTVLAILPGGNVTVPAGKTVGATFTRLPLCTASGQAGCVIAYSTFPSQPPADSVFGRPGQGVSLQSGQTATAGLQVACVNPAALSGGTADLDALFPTPSARPPGPKVTTPWVSYPDLYSGTCRTAAGATWLQVTTLGTAGRPTVKELQGPGWGYHAADVNLALGNLVADVRAAEAGYSGRG